MAVMLTHLKPSCNFCLQLPHLNPPLPPPGHLLGQVNKILSLSGNSWSAAVSRSSDLGSLMAIIVSKARDPLFITCIHPWCSATPAPSRLDVLLCKLASLAAHVCGHCMHVGELGCSLKAACCLKQMRTTRTCCIILLSGQLP